MRKSYRARGLISLALACFMAALASPADALTITQAPCDKPGPSRYCYKFQTGFSGPATVRTIAFTPPKVGDATVIMNGTGFCTNISSHSTVVAIFETQIVSDPNGLPSAVQPGGNTFWLTMEPNGTGPNGTQPFNLGSTRVFPISSTARQTYYFRINVTRVDQGISCELYNMSFSILFLPK